MAEWVDEYLLENEPDVIVFEMKCGNCNLWCSRIVYDVPQYYKFCPHCGKRIEVPKNQNQ